MNEMSNNFENKINELILVEENVFEPPPLKDIHTALLKKDMDLNDFLGIKPFIDD